MSRVSAAAILLGVTLSLPMSAHAAKVAAIASDEVLQGTSALTHVMVSKPFKIIEDDTSHGREINLGEKAYRVANVRKWWIGVKKRFDYYAPRVPEYIWRIQMTLAIDTWPF